MMKGSKAAPREPRDFVTENAIAAIIASPRKAAPAAAPANPNFAKRPAYLDRIAAQLAAERDYVLRLADAQQRDAEVAGGMREMGAEERSELLQQLKAKWTEVSNVRGAGPSLARVVARRPPRCRSARAHPLTPPLSSPPPPLQHNPLSKPSSATACLRTRRSPRPAPPWGRSASRKTASGS
jgi:hypothetical protein